MNVNLIKKPQSRAALSKNFLKLAVQDFQTVCKHVDCSLADVWSAHLDRKQNKEAEQCRQLSEQTSFLPCKKNTCRQRRTQSPIIVPLSLRSSNCSEQSISTVSNTRAEVSIFIWQQWSDGKFRKKFLSDEEANELLTRLAIERAQRTAKSQIQ